MFGSAIDLARVSIRRRRFFPLQPRQVAMAPRGHIHFHPRATLYCDDFAAAPLPLRALFVHEMTHVWQAQTRGSWWLVLMRHPWCRYHYALRPGWPLARYGIEQQAEIVKHTFLLRQGKPVAGAPPLASYEAILPF
ncbi:MAG: vgr related protein [Novosphingobium sp.]